MNMKNCHRARACPVFLVKTSRLFFSCFGGIGIRRIFCPCARRRATGRANGRRRSVKEERARQRKRIPAPSGRTPGVCISPPPRLPRPCCRDDLASSSAVLCLPSSLCACWAPLCWAALPVLCPPSKGATPPLRRIGRRNAEDHDCRRR